MKITFLSSGFTACSGAVRVGCYLQKEPRVSPAVLLLLLLVLIIGISATRQTEELTVRLCF